MDPSLADFQLTRRSTRKRVATQRYTGDDEMPQSSKKVPRIAREVVVPAALPPPSPTPSPSPPTLRKRLLALQRELEVERETAAAAGAKVATLERTLKTAADNHARELDAYQQREHDVHEVTERRVRAAGVAHAQELSAVTDREREAHRASETRVQELAATHAAALQEAAALSYRAARADAATIMQYQQVLQAGFGYAKLIRPSTLFLTGVTFGNVVNEKFEPAPTGRDVRIITSAGWVAIVTAHGRIVAIEPTPM